MSCALTIRDRRSSPASTYRMFDYDRCDSTSICDKLRSIPDRITDKFASRIKKLDMKVGMFLLELTAEIEKAQRSQFEKGLEWGWEEDDDLGHGHRPPSRHRRSPQRSLSRSRSQSPDTRYVQDSQGEYRSPVDPKGCSLRPTATYQSKPGWQTIVDAGNDCGTDVRESSDDLIYTPFVAPLRFPDLESSQLYSINQHLVDDRPSPRIVTMDRSTHVSLHSDADFERHSTDSTKRDIVSRPIRTVYSTPTINPDTKRPFHEHIACHHRNEATALRTSWRKPGTRTKTVTFQFTERQIVRMRIAKQPLKSRSSTQSKYPNKSKAIPESKPQISLPVSDRQIDSFDSAEFMLWQRLTKDCRSKARKSARKARRHHRSLMS